MVEKKCVKCSVSKNIDDFYKNKGTKDGYYNICKICKLKNGKKWEINNLEKRLQDKRDNYLTSKESRRKQQKIWNNLNKGKMSNYYRKYRVDNKDKLKIYREANRDKLLTYRRGWGRRYRENYPHKCIWYDIIRKSLRGHIVKPKGDDKTITLLKYTPDQLKQRIECQFKKGMSWDNYGEWHIDHKKPISVFNEHTPIHIVNLLANLQPLWAKDNLSKGNKFYVKK